MSTVCCPVCHVPVTVSPHAREGRCDACRSRRKHSKSRWDWASALQSFIARSRGERPMSQPCGRVHLGGLPPSRGGQDTRTGRVRARNLLALRPPCAPHGALAPCRRPVSGRNPGSPPARDPRHYVHGLDGKGVVIVPARIAAWLHQQLPLDRLRTEMRGADPEIDHVLIGLSVAGFNWRSSVVGTSPRNGAELKPRSPWLTASEAADQLGVTVRAVTKACRAGRLPAQWTAGRWSVSREDLEHYRTARQQRAV